MQQSAFDNPTETSRQHQHQRNIHVDKLTVINILAEHHEQQVLTLAACPIPPNFNGQTQLELNSPPV